MRAYDSGQGRTLRDDHDSTFSLPREQQRITQQQETTLHGNHEDNSGMSRRQLIKEVEVRDQVIFQLLKENEELRRQLPPQAVSRSEATEMSGKLLYDYSTCSYFKFSMIGEKITINSSC